MWWLPPLLRVGAGASEHSTVDVADSLSVSCGYLVNLCMLGETSCTPVYQGSLGHAVSVASLVVAAPATGAGAAGAGASPTNVSYSSESHYAVESMDISILSIPMVQTPGAAFVVAKTVNIDVSGVSLDVEACQGCSLPDSQSPRAQKGTNSSWVPLYSLTIGRMRTYCSTAELSGEPCTVSLPLDATQHSVPNSLLSSVGVIALPSLVSGLSVIPAPLKQAIVAALSTMKGASSSDDARNCKWGSRSSNLMTHSTRRPVNATDGGSSTVNLRVISHLNASALACSSVWGVSSGSLGGRCSLVSTPVDQAPSSATFCTLATAAALAMQDCSEPSSVTMNAFNKLHADSIATLWGANLIIRDGTRMGQSMPTRVGRRAQTDPAGISPNFYWTLYSPAVQSSLYNWTLYVNASFSASDTGFFSAYVYKQLLNFASSMNVVMTAAAEVDVDPQWQRVPGASFDPAGAFPSGQFPASVPRASPVWWQSACGSVTLSTSSAGGSGVIKVCVC